MNYFLSFRYQSMNSGGPVTTGRIEQVAGLALGTAEQLMVEQRVTFLVHGYNVDRNTSRQKLLKLADYLAAQNPDSGLVALTWPGDDHRLGFASYPLEGRDADDTAAQLSRFIDRALLPTAELSFVSHSLGARVVMETVKRLRGGPRPIGQVCLMAAAIDDDCLAAPLSYRKATEATARVTVLSSEADTVLKSAYPIGTFLERFVLGGSLVVQALGYHGPKPYKDQAIPAQVLKRPIRVERGVDHGDYLPDPVPSLKQSAAMEFVHDALAGQDPIYP